MKEDSSNNSLVICMELLRAGDPAAQQKIWEEFFPQLVNLARRRLLGIRIPQGDEEDVALSVLNSFLGNIAENRYPDLRGSDSLWRLLSWMTHRKAIDWIRFAKRQKRQSLGESAIEPAGEPGMGLAGVPSELPPPDLEAMLSEEVRRLMSMLPGDMRFIASQKLDGFSNHEIAERQGCSLATVERRLKMIREIWSNDVETRTQADERE